MPLQARNPGLWIFLFSLYFVVNGKEDQTAECISPDSEKDDKMDSPSTEKSVPSAGNEENSWH